MHPKKLVLEATRLVYDSDGEGEPPGSQTETAGSHRSEGSESQGTERVSRRHERAAFLLVRVCQRDVADALPKMPVQEADERCQQLPLVPIFTGLDKGYQRAT